MPLKKNAFSFFLDQYVDEERRRGRYISKKDGSVECGPLWTKMSEHEKKKYVDLSKAFKREQHTTVENINQQWLDPVCRSDGNIGYAMAGSDIRYLITNINNGEALRTHNFYIIHFNYYCRTEDGVYLPGEVALLEFNLEEGIRQTYHTLIDPGKAPLGYAYEIIRVADEVHGLPIPPHDEGEKNLDLIFSEIVDFLKPGMENGDFPPLFTIEQNVVASTDILKKLSRNSEYHSPLKVYPIHRMFFWLKNKCTEYCGNEPGFPVMANAMTEIEKDVFRYCTGISCKFHSELADKFQNCSLSIVQRMAYVICDHCCCHLNIKLVRGKHVHQNSVERSEDTGNHSTVILCDVSDVTSNAPEDFDYCGASTYASSIFEDRLEALGRDFPEEEDEEDRSKGLSGKGVNREEIIMKIRGRGRKF